MADTAAHLVDNVFPKVPVRQWVLSLPFEIRYRMSYDKRLISDLLAVFLRVIQGWHRNKAKAPRGRSGGTRVCARQSILD